MSISIVRSSERDAKKKPALLSGLLGTYTFNTDNIFVALILEDTNPSSKTNKQNACLELKV